VQDSYLGSSVNDVGVRVIWRETPDERRAPLLPAPFDISTPAPYL
jgi:hypothetical protein